MTDMSKHFCAFNLASKSATRSSSSLDTVSLLGCGQAEGMGGGGSEASGLSSGRQTAGAYELLEPIERLKLERGTKEPKPLSVRFMRALKWRVRRALRWVPDIIGGLALFGMLWVLLVMGWAVQ